MSSLLPSALVIFPSLITYYLVQQQTVLCVLSPVTSVDSPRVLVLWLVPLRSYRTSFHPHILHHPLTWCHTCSQSVMISQSVSQSVRTSLNLSPIPFLISFDHQCIVQEDRQSIFPPRDYTLPGPVANCPFSTFSSNICRLAMSSCSLTWPPAVIPYIFPPSLPTPLIWCSWGDSFNESTEIKNYFTISLTLYVS